MDSFLLVPVIDLLAGQVVRAVRGQRSQYQPMQSALCAGSAPLPLARALLARCASGTLYVADLDAILGRPAQAALLRELLAGLPAVTLWLDAGFKDAAAAHATLAALGEAAHRVRPVFGTESFNGSAAFEDCFGEPGGAVAEDAAKPVLGALLSLDQRGAAPLDPAGAWARAGRWPRELIVMTLDRVGADAGPDLATLAAIRERAPRARLFGAGGIRSQADLDTARAAGAAGWLVASALHDGKLGAP
ncbi:HisA/HisF-related TIM barrel protein [Azohydromonas lata]|uniref:HisA/HisF-related TIM barrel protein n=1 Tax=Azohydromonas lata TaxID=45677 RepID=UPI0008310D4E|nr:HisA/HisF-related TIM barrel protein [Azohydromonas lata]